MRATLIICTRNRAASLDRTLASLAEMRLPPGLVWELVVVDNGSTDSTPAVVESYAPRLPIRRVSEPQPGLSNARNRGVAESRGEYVVWTDDDVLVQPDWLAAYLRAFEAFPDCAVFGGKVTPVLEGPTPGWFAANRELLSLLLAERNFGEAAVPLDPGQHRLPFGANYAVRGLEQRRHLYDPELGVGPNRSRSGEETQVIRAILAEGARGMWLPDAEVLHQIPASRQTEAYVVSYSRAIGETWAHLRDRGLEMPMGPGLEDLSNRVLGAPLAGWIRLANHGCKYQLLRRLGPSRKWLWHLMQYGYYKGVVDHWRRGATS